MPGLTRVKVLFCVLLGGLFFGLQACVCGVPPVEGPDDAGSDAGPADAGSADAGPDAGPADAGSSDAGAVDAGPADAGPADAGPADAGAVDAGPVDSGSSDSGIGPCDAGLYGCVSGCCPYDRSAVGGVCLYDVDISALSLDRWSIVSYFPGASHPTGNDVALVVVEQRPGGLTQRTLETTFVPTLQEPHAHVGVALDSQGQAHVVAADYWGTARPRYFPPDGGAQSIDCGIPAVQRHLWPGTVAIAVDLATDLVHLAWPAMDDPADVGYVMHAQRTTTGWVCETVDQGWQDEFVGPVSVTVDAAGQPVVGFLSTTSGAREVRVRRRVGGAWSSVPVGDAGVDVTDFAVGVAGLAPWVAVSKQSRFVSTVMTPTAASALVTSVPQVGPWPSVLAPLATFSDESSRYRVAFLQQMPGAGFFVLNDAVLTSAGWRIDTVDATPLNRGAGTVDPSGHGHFVACGANSTFTHFAR